MKNSSHLYPSPRFDLFCGASPGSLLALGVVFCLVVVGCAPGPRGTGGEDGAATGGIDDGGQDPVATSTYDPVRARALTVEAMQASQQGDFLTGRDLLEQAASLRPGQVEIWMLLAGIEHQLGNEEAAAEALERVAAIGLTPPFERAPFYDTLIDAPPHTETVAALAEKAYPLSVAETFIRLESRDLIPEGVAYDRQDDTLFVSSVHRRSILKIKDGVETPLVSEGSLWSVLGMAVDPLRRLLWASTAALPQMRDYEPELEGRSALVAIDLRTGEEKGRFELPRDRAHTLNDLVVARDGTVLASDNRIPGNIYRLDPDGQSLEPLIPEGFFRSPQGLALSGDEKRLYVADYSLGLTRLDLVDLAADEDKAQYLAPPSFTCLTGIDGLVWVGSEGDRDILLAVQNLYRPHRVLRITVENGLQRTMEVEVMEQARPDYSEPTLGAMVQGDFVYIANSQWDRFDQAAQLPPVEELEQPLLLRLSRPGGF